jgi:hypothetical protein
VVAQRQLPVLLLDVLRRGGLRDVHQVVQRLPAASETRLSDLIFASRLTLNIETAHGQAIVIKRICLVRELLYYRIFRHIRIPHI